MKLISDPFLCTYRLHLLDDLVFDVDVLEDCLDDHVYFVEVVVWQCAV